MKNETARVTIHIANPDVEALFNQVLKTSASSGEYKLIG
jgi:hypothetical protein